MGTRKLATLVALVLSMALLLAFAPACAPAGDGSDGGAVKTEYEWRCASPYTMRTLNESVSLFCTLVNSYSGGRMNVEFYPDGLLGSHDETFSAVQEGSIEMAVLGPMVNLVPGGMINWMPFSVGSFDEAALAYAPDGPISPIMKDAWREVGAEMIWPVYLGALGVANTQRPLETPADFANLKFRVSGTTSAVRCIENMAAGTGLTLQTMPWADVYNGLQLGAIDACWSGWSTMVESRLTEVVKYFTPLDFLWDAGNVIVNSDLWSDLPADLQDIVVKAGREAELRNAEAYRRNDLAYRQQIVDAGVEIYFLTPAEREVFIQKANVDAIWKELADPWLETMYPGQNKSATLQRELDAIRLAVAD